MSFFAELKRRNVFKVGIAYAVVAWLVLQFADVVLNNVEAPDWVFSVIMLVLGIGLPVALVFAWAFEMTPEGIKREHEVDRSQSITPQTGRKLDFVIIGVLVLALGYFVVDKFLLQGTGQETAQQAPGAGAVPNAARTLAVLPLVNMSADAANEYFADGLTEELLNILAKISELKVAGRTSSFAFKGKNEDLREIASKLNVEAILEGSVRKDEERVRITLQLINAADGYHLWSETYDRELDDIFAIQEEVAHEVAKALRITLLGEDEQRLASAAQADLSAYDLYLQGLEQLNRFSYASLPLAESLFRQSMERDPDYLPARLKLVDTWHNMSQTGLISGEAAADRSQPLLDEVLAGDPRNDEALTLQGLVLVANQELQQASGFLERALAINPRNVRALGELGHSFLILGELDRGLEYLDEAERLDPYSVEVLWSQAYAGSITRDPERAMRYAQRIGEIEPANPNRYYAAGLAFELSGDLASALDYHYRTREIDPDDYEIPAGIAELWLDLGDPQQAEPWLEMADRMGADQTQPVVARLRSMLYREQRAMAADLGQRSLKGKLPSRPGSEFAFRTAWIGWLFDQGQYEEALQYYRERIPLSFGTPADFRPDWPFEIDLHMEAAVLLLAIDPASAQAKDFLDATAQKLQRRDPRTFAWRHALGLAAIAAARGEREAALTLVGDAIDKGLRVGWQLHLVETIVFRSLQQDPEFKALVARVEQDMARQRELAHELLQGRTGP